MQQTQSKRRIFFVSFVIFLAVVIAVLLCLKKNNNWISILVEISQTVTLTEINDDYEATEHVLSKEESKELLRILDLEAIDFTDDVFKSAFEPVYLVELAGNHVFKINRFAGFPEYGFYITHSKNGILKYTYLGAPLDETVVTSIQLMTAKISAP